MTDALGAHQPAARERVDLICHDADVVVVCDDAGTALRGTSVLITGGMIVGVLPAAEVSARLAAGTLVAGEVRSMRRRLLMPGFVNSHTHLPMTLLRGVAEDLDLQGFLTRVWAAEAELMGPAGTRIGARLGALEAVRAGTTTALDMYFHPIAAHEGAVAVGLRHVIGPVFFDFPGPDNLTWAERITLAHEWPAAVAATGGAAVPHALMPHAPFTNGPARLAELAELAGATGAMIHTHASENDAENDQTQRDFGTSPVRMLAGCGVLDHRCVIAHGVRLDDVDRSLLAAADAAIAHCPGSNMKLASGALHWPRWRESGIRLTLGTDGCASSNDLDMFTAMRQAATLARLTTADPAAVSAVDIVRAATREGAHALGLGHLIGMVAPGMAADLIVLDRDAPHLTPLRDPYTALVWSAGRGDVVDVLVDGRWAVRDRVASRVDEQEVMSAARSHVGQPDIASVRP